MFGSATRRGVYLALVALGAFSQVAQALLGRELLVVFHGNEISLGGFYGAWLMWIAIGAVAAAKLARRGRAAASGFRAILLALPGLLAFEVLAAREVRSVVGVPVAELVPLGKLLLATVVLTLPVSFAVGVAFPLGCRMLTEVGEPADGVGGRVVRDVSYLYVFEAAGALGGGVLFTFVFLHWLGIWAMVGAAGLLLCAGILGLGRPSRRVVVAAALVAACGLALVTTPLGGWLDRRSEQARFATLHPGLELVDSFDTRYGHVTLSRLADQLSIAYDGRIAVSFPDTRAMAEDAAFFYAEGGAPRRVLLFGGVASGLAAALLRYPIDTLDVVEDDREAFERLRPHFDPDTRAALADPRLAVHFGDGRRFINPRSDRVPYDLVLVLTPDPASAHLNRYFTRDFYARTDQAMTRNAALCTEVTSAENYLGTAVAGYSGSVLRTLGAVFAEVVVVPGDVHIFCASPATGRVTADPILLAERQRAAGVDPGFDVAAAFDARLDPRRVAETRAALDAAGGELNTDLKPVTYYLNMVLWGEFTGSGLVSALNALRQMGPWTWLIPLLVLVPLLGLRSAAEGHGRPRRRRSSSIVAVTVIGFVAMALQLVVLLSYQAEVGFVFSRIALLNGVFMTGLALGAGGVGQRLGRRGRPGPYLAGLLLVITGACAGLPTLLHGFQSLSGWSLEGAYLAAATMAGVLTGIGFPLGVALANRPSDVISASATVEAADHFGGALGGLLSGAVLAPLLGISGTSTLLSLAALVAGLAVVSAELVPVAANPPARGRSSFPFTRTSWAIGFLVITIYALSRLAAGVGPRPLVHFDDTTLAQVSGSQRFEQHDDPMVYYLGSGPGLDDRLGAPTPGSGERSGPRDTERTVSLASSQVAGDVRGYAGPIDLLVSIDDSGVLRGVRYLGSQETPAYLIDFEEWLAGLAGRSLAEQPLTAADVDVMTGATITSKAALETIDRAARAGGQAGLGISVAPVAAHVGPPLITAKLVFTLVALVLFVPVFLRGSDRLRLGYQLLALVGFGLVFNSLLTEIDLANLGLGRLPSWQSNPFFYLIIGFVAITTLLWGQVYCGYVCPFGALQELVSRLGRRLGWRAYAHQYVEMRVRYARFVLAAAVFTAVWVTGDLVWVSFDPMQRFFELDLGGWLTWLAVASLVGSLFYYRFWCRYVCPAGAVLALGNKLAVAARAPRRDFRRCDLRARAEFDVNCIRCYRCRGGADIGVRKPHSARSPEVSGQVEDE